MTLGVKHELVRIRNLKPGDAFIWLGYEYIVKELKEGEIHFVLKQERSNNPTKYKFGATCMMWVEKSNRHF